MSPTTTARHRIRRSALVLGALGLAVLPAGAASAAPAPQPGPTGATVTAVSSLGDRVASPDGETTLTLTGAGFQSIDGGFGGLYVLFGWVADGAWQPSAGGGFGETYAYQPDTQAAENAGYQKFVTFPGSSTASEANGAELALDGSWATDLVIPGPVLTVTDAAGENARELDCRVETCGIITFGAHGVVNANNETFTPISFAPVAAAESEAAPEAPAETATESPSETATPTPQATPSPEGEVTASAQESGTSDVGSADTGSDSSAAPWVVAGSAGAAAIAAAVTAGVVAKRRKDAARAE
ncbi:hypothetical protein C8046_09965 [Serinibacter arcticus]|uniref:Minor silk ampullate protein n=1 Tax=Serinibacter arcticus TaxID=1655435 RepID=A0A2U1ZVC1_9MICO|nr:hypothetical protein [Serinibacter arcticus]PWD50929.1 hypothetical protein C8046_09965 [Serinibacter arcticus]